MKRIKHFQDWEDQKVHESEILNSIYQDLISENFSDSTGEDSSSDNFSEDDKPETEMTWGEKIAFARNLQILTREQMAGLYLRALEIFEEANGKYLYTIPGLRNYGKIDSLGNFRISYGNLGKALGIQSQGTVARTIKKYVRILSGLESSEDETLYPKIFKATEEFGEMSPREIISLVEKIIQIDPSAGIGPKLLAATLSQKEKLSKTGKKVDVLFQQLKNTLYSQDFEKARRIAIEKIAREENLANEYVAKAFDEFKKPVKKY